MPKFNVGDRFTRRGATYPMWEVTSVEGNEVYRIDIVINSRGEPERRDLFKHMLNYSDFTIVAQGNPNLITVSSLDYMTSTTLTDEDKEIIKEHLAYA